MMNQDVIIGMAVVQLATYGFVYGQAVRPYGPQMCEESCTHLSRCSSFGFNPSSLSCQIATDRSDESNFVKFSFNESKKKPTNCSKVGRIIRTKSKMKICVSGDKRKKRACPVNFHHDVDAATCLLLVKAAKTFYEAEHDCVKRGEDSHLAVLNSIKDIKSATAYTSKYMYSGGIIFIMQLWVRSSTSPKKISCGGNMQLQHCFVMQTGIGHCLSYFNCYGKLHGHLCQVDIN